MYRNRASYLVLVSASIMTAAVGCQSGETGGTGANTSSSSSSSGTASSTSSSSSTSSTSSSGTAGGGGTGGTTSSSSTSSTSSGTAGGGGTGGTTSSTSSTATGGTGGTTTTSTSSTATGGTGGTTTTSTSSTGAGGADQIADVRAAADGAVSNLPVHGVFVTYTKPLLGLDAAGFFVQATAAGPAIFVAVDPASLPTPVKVGDMVSFEVTTVATQDGLKEATAITTPVIVSSGNAIGPLVTDVSSAADLVSNLTAYESRAIRITGSFAANFTSAGAPQVASAIATAGLTDPNLKLRMPEAIRAQYGLGAGCTATADYGVMWRFNAGAQPSVYNAADLKSMTCPAPTVVSATPISSTQVVVNFDRPLDPATVQASDFAFDGGLVAQAVSVNGSTVTVTTTSETGGQTYTVTVTNLNDTIGAPIGTPNTAIFKGYVQLASMLINEIGPNIASSHDLVELLVTSPGSTNGITLLQKGSVVDTLATLPDVLVATGDIIVIHLVPSGTVGIAPASETTSKNQYATALYGANYDGAWDFLGGTTGLSNRNRVIELDAPGGAVIDAVPFVVSNAGTPLAAFPSVLQTLQAAGLWLPADCGGALCTYTSTPTAVGISVDYLGVGTTATANSVARKPGMNTKQKSDWNAAGQQSWGAANP